MRVRCISKNRNDKGAIVNYNLIDEKGNKFQATSQQIKSEIKAGKYEFTNLQIDKAGRLVDKAEEKPVQAKVKSSTSQNKEEIKKENDKKERAKVAKKEVTDYIDYMKEEYVDSIDGDIKFRNDLIGEGNIVYADGDTKLVCKMTDATRRYFEMILETIRKKAKTSSIEAYRYDYENFSVNYPESVEKFIQSSGLGNFIKEELFYDAANEEIAMLECGYGDNHCDACSDGFVGKLCLTGKYEEAKKFIIDCVNEEAMNTDRSPSEIMVDGNLVEGGNMLGRVFILKFYADMQKHNTEYYKKQVLELAQTPDYMRYSSGTDESIRRVLRHEACGLSYLALKMGVLPARDDWDTEEEKKIEDKITAEAERLAHEILGLNNK